MANTHSLDLEKDSSQYAYRADPANLDVGGALSIECWVKLESAPGNNSSMEIVNKDGVTSSTHRGWNFYYYNSSGTYQIVLFVDKDGSVNANAFDFLQINYTISLNTWTHIAVTWLGSSKTAKFYVNGSQQGTDQVGSNVTSIYGNSAAFQIGHGIQNSYFDGLIDDVRVWNDVRTVTEISDNKNAELVGNEANLVGYWKLNNDYNDSTANAYHLTSSGSPVFSTDIPDWGGSPPATTVHLFGLLGIGA